MFGRRIYYLLKPVVPQTFRTAFRRWHATRILRQLSNGWPISESAGRQPSRWPGWPGGKSFALVLTHDVEGSRGYQQIPQLMALEAQLGLRSSFNLVPEGEYRVEESLRKEIQREGFEVGVHDLHHDGHLYDTQASFRRKVQRINGYLREWKAVGFRSAFMLHDLDWLRQLDVRYDASTFDVDPFEPQPDGVNTIFPFWVSGRASQAGYAELPYTLPQDSTLFLVLEKRTNQAWTEKLDWIARRGGMALINVHPDYLKFPDGTRSQAAQYPADLYGAFLRRIDEQYRGAYWLALPREVADFVSIHRDLLPPPATIDKMLS